MAIAKVDISAYSYQNGQIPNLTYGWMIATEASEYSPALLTRRVWIELPDGVELALPNFSGASMLRLCRKGYDCKDGNVDICQVNIAGAESVGDPLCVGVKIPGSDVAEVKAKISELISAGLTISMPTNVRGKREVAPVKVVRDDGYLDYSPLH